MAQTLIQSKVSQGSSSTNSTTLAFDSSVTAGSTIVVCASCFSTLSNTFSSSDSVNGSHTGIQTANENYDGNDYAAFEYVQNAGSGSTTVTLSRDTGSGTWFFSLVILEFGETDTTAALEASNSAIDSGGSPVDSGNATAAGGAVFVGLWAQDNGNHVLTADSPYAQVFEEPDSAANMPIEVSYHVVTSGTTDSFGGTYTGGAVTGFVGVAVLKTAAAGGLSVAITPENAKLSASPQAATTPLLPALQTETALLGDQVTAQLTPLLAATGGEAALLSDAPTVQLALLLVTVAAEAAVVQDTPSAAISLEASVTESARLSETAPAGQLDPLLAGLATEQARLSESLLQELALLLAPVADEPLAVQDSGPSAGLGETPTLSRRVYGTYFRTQIMPPTLLAVIVSVESLSAVAGTVSRTWHDTGDLAFVASPDHATVISYEARLRLFGSETVIDTEPLGKPTPDGNGVIIVPLAGFLAYRAAGQYTISIAATDAVGTTDSAPSPAFSLPLPWPTERFHVTESVAGVLA